MTAAQHNRNQAASLAFLAGYVDTLGFIALFGLFTAHVTGNFILIGSALADSSQMSILLKFLAFPAFVIGVAGARLFIAAIQKRNGAALPWTLLLQLVFLVGFMVCGIIATPVQSPSSSWGMAAGLLGTVGMGVHSAISRLLLSHLAPTSLMTGNVTQVVIDTVDVLRGGADGATSERCMKFLWPVLSFGVGAIVAAFGYHAFGFWALALPIAILAVMVVGELSRARAGVAAA